MHAIRNDQTQVAAFGFEALRRIAGAGAAAMESDGTDEMLDVMVTELDASGARWFVGRHFIGQCKLELPEEHAHLLERRAPWTTTMVGDLEVQHIDLGEVEGDPFVDAMRAAGHRRVTLLSLAAYGTLELYDLPDEARDETLMAALVVQVGAVSTQLDLRARYHQMRSDREALQEIAMAITGASGEDEAMRVGLHQVCESLGWTYAAFWFWDPDMQCLSYAMDAGQMEMGLQMASMMSPLVEGAGLPGMALAKKGSVITDDLTTLADDRLGFTDPALFQCVAATPIYDEDRLVGVLELGMLDGMGVVDHLVDRQETLDSVGRMLGRLLGRISQTTEGNKLTAIVECSAACLVFANTQREIEYLNPAAGALFDRLAPQVGKCTAELKGHHVDAIGGRVGFIEELVEKGLPQRAQVEHDDVTLLLDAQTIQAGDIDIGILLTVEDITERIAMQRKEAAMRKKEAEMAIQERKRQAERQVEQERRAREQRQRAEEARARAEEESRRAEELRSAVQDLLEVVQTAASGDLTVRAPKEGPQLIRLLSSGVQSLLDSLRKSLEQMTQESHNVTGASKDVAGIAEELAASSSAADASCAQAASEAEIVDERIADVLEAADEMRRSLDQLGARVAQTNQTTARAVDRVDQGHGRVGELVQTGQRIGSMVGAIGRIAAQTKLLALNASIEAARAGAAGRGFGVVAKEVKSLAREVEAATKDITEQIRAIRAQSDDMESVFQEMRQVISELDQVTTTVSESASLQVDLNDRIQGSVMDAAAAAERVTDTFGPLRDQTSTAAGIARKMQEGAGQLGQVADGLDEIVGAFRL